MEVKRGEIYLVNFKAEGNKQGGYRPCVVVSNQMCNNHSPVVTVVALTSQQGKNKLPTHVQLYQESGLIKPSVALCEQIISINKFELSRNPIGFVPENKMVEIDRAMTIQIDTSKYISKIFNTIKRINEVYRYIYNYNPVNKQEYMTEIGLMSAELKKLCYWGNVDYELVSSGINDLQMGESGYNDKQVFSYA